MASPPQASPPDALARVSERVRAVLRAGSVYRDTRVLAILVLGFASGLPLALTFGTLTFWLAEAGIEKGAIGLFALAGTAYGWKFVWAPLVDRLPLPGFTALLGRRRGWLLFFQLALIVSILALGASDPGHSIALTAVLAVVVAFFSASQDIVIDAYRVEILEERQQGAGAAVIVIGYRVAMLVSGAGALFIAEFFGWFAAYASMAALLLVGVATTLLTPEPAAGPQVAAAGPRPSPAQRLRATVIEPFAEFLRRNGLGTAVVILLFIMFYKLGDAMLGVMSNPFFVETGFSKDEVASVVKTFGFFATLGGGLLGGMLINARGIIPALWVCGILQMVSNLVFAAQAYVGHSVSFLALTIGVENLAGGMGTAAFVAYLSSLCNVHYTATQYALLTSFMAQTRTVLASGGGFIAESVDWISFFLLTTAAAAPAFVLLWWLSHGRRPLLAAEARAAE